MKRPVPVIAVIATLLLFGCMTDWPSKARTFKPEFFIECLLVQGQPVDSVWVGLTYDILDVQDSREPVYDSAFLVVYTASDSDTLIAKDSMPNCFYSPDTQVRVRCGETYFLYAALYKKGVDPAVMRAKTTVPDTFSCIPMAPVWLTDTSRVQEFLNRNYMDLSLVDTATGEIIYYPFLPPFSDTGYYLYNDTLRFYTFLLCIFYDQVFELADGSSLSLFSALNDYFGIAPPLPPGPSAKGVMVEYEWGIGVENWDDLTFVMNRGFGGNMDSTGYYLHKHLNGGVMANTRRDLAFFFGNYAAVKYTGRSAFNIYAIDEGAYDYEITKRQEDPVSNISGGRGVFGSASVFRVPFFMQADSLLITNGEAKAIADRRREENQ